MAPEGGLRGSHTDVWGFATTVLHLATGHLPYQGLTHWQIMSAMSQGRLPEVPSSLPEWLQEALTSCLSFDTAAGWTTPTGPSILSAMFLLLHSTLPVSGAWALLLASLTSSCPEVQLGAVRAVWQVAFYPQQCHKDAVVASGGLLHIGH